MLELGQQVFLTGLLLGLANSLHCLAMCGGVIAGLSLVGTKGASSGRLFLSAILLNAGRASSYVALGGVIGTLGTAALPPLGPSDSVLLARAAGVIVLSWTGLSLAGLLPVPRLILTVGHTIYSELFKVPQSLALPWFAKSFLGGIAWGFLPCAMVYSALFYAAFAGSWAGGGVAMLGFGVGTSLPLIATGIGVPGLNRIAAIRRHPRTWAIGLMTVAVAGLLVPDAAMSWLCLDR